MKPDRINIDDFVQRHLPSAERDGRESDGSRVLRELEASAPQTLSFPIAEAGNNRWVFRVTLSIAAALIILLILSIAFIKDVIAPGQVYAIVETVAGSQPVAPGERIPAGFPLRTGNGAVVLKLPDGARIEMHPRSEVSFERVEDGVRIRLSDGSVSVTPSKEPVGNLYVQNQEATVPVVAELFQTARTGNPASEPKQVFEVATIRPSAPLGRGGGGRGAGPRESGGGPLSSCMRLAVQLDPGRLVATRASVVELITVAYGYRCPFPGLISGGPDWVRSSTFDIQGVIPAGGPASTRQELAEGKAPRLQEMMQNLLSERFKLALRRDTKELASFNLVVVNPARLKLSEDQTGMAPPKPFVTEGPVFLFSGSMANYATVLQGQLGVPVFDKTGLRGLYDLLLPLPELSDPLRAGETHDSRLDNLLLSKLEPQLGLRLEPIKAAVETLVIEHVEQPSEN
jgi:uncharacterized protein (TIGR03435 family)